MAVFWAELDPTQRLSKPFAASLTLHVGIIASSLVWGALQNNRVYAARYRHLTSRETNKLKPTQAQTVIAAAILRQLHAVITSGQAWNPDIATHGTRHRPVTLTGVVAA